MAALTCTVCRRPYSIKDRHSTIRFVVPVPDKVEWAEENLGKEVDDI